MAFTIPTDFVPDVVEHPGDMLADELATRNMSQRALAKLALTTPTMINALIKRKKGISLSLALRLEQALGISAEYWINTQRMYDRAEQAKKYKRQMQQLNVPASRQESLLKHLVD